MTQTTNSGIDCFTSKTEKSFQGLHPSQIADPSQTTDLSQIPDREVLSRLERLTKSERKIMHLVLWHILEVDSRKLYLKLDYISLYQYLTRHLGYSESAAYDRIQAMRVLKKVPAIAPKLEDGTLKLSQLVKVEQSLKQEKKLGHKVSLETTQTLLNKLEHQSSYQTEKILAQELNQTPRKAQRISPQQDDSVRLEMTFTAEQYALLQKAQSLFSHVVPGNSLSDLITELAKVYLQKKEGKVKTPAQGHPGRESQPHLEKISPAEKASGSTQSFRLNPFSTSEDITAVSEKNQVSASTPKSRKRVYLPVKIRRSIFQKAQHCCEHLNPHSQRRCNSRFQLQIDHIKPKARGGTDEITNLRLLCGVHNRLEALRWGLGRPLQ